MADRCDVTELLVTDCAHCRNLPDLDVEETVASRRGTWFTALYAGRCSNCKTTFEPGASIRADGYGNGGWLAECCGTVPEQVYREAAIAYTATAGWEPRVRAAASDPYAQERQFRAAVEVAYRAGRTAAAQAIIDHADEHFPADEEPYWPARRAFRRHLLAAARIADNPITPEQAAEALRQGNYIACRAEDIEGVDG